MFKIVNVNLAKRYKSITENIQNNGFVIYIIIEKVDISILKNNLYIV